MAVFLTPGPSQAYPRLREFMDDAWGEDVMSISHRGKKFTDIYRRADAGVRDLMGVPSDWRVMFTGSATEAMERLLQGLARERTHHFVNGAFSKKWYEMAGQLGKTATQQRVEAGEGFAGVDFAPADEAELVCVTMNETSTGVVWPAGELARLSSHYARPLVAVDVVSAAPLVPVPWNEVDAAFFSVQKAFGLPAGLGVLLMGPRALARAEELDASKAAVGSYHRLAALAAGASNFQTPATPNVLGIYLLGRVAEDMLSRGADELRAENRARALALYEAISAHEYLTPFVEDSAWRSPTVIVAEVSGGSAALHEHMMERGYIPGRGYGKFKDNHVRLANFPATSDREFEEVLSHLVQFVGHAGVA